MTATAQQTASLFASIAGPVATIAETPQTDVPTAKSVPKRLDNLSHSLSTPVNSKAVPIQAATTAASNTPSSNTLKTLNRITRRTTPRRNTFFAAIENPQSNSAGKETALLTNNPSKTAIMTAEIGI